MHIIQKSGVLRTSESHFSFVWVIENGVISMFGKRQTFGDSSNLTILLHVQRLHEKSV